MRLEYNRQELLFRKLVDQEIPDALKEWSNQKYLGYTIDFKELPICMADAVEESGTQYIMSRAICTITNDTTNEIQDFTVDLLKIPVITNSGIKINNSNMQVLDLYARAPGWSVETDYSQELDSAGIKQGLEKRQISLLAINKSSLRLIYKKTYGISVKLKEGTVPISVFLKALTGYSPNDFISMFGIDNPFILDAFITKATKKNRNDCIDEVYNACYSQNYNSGVIRNVTDKLNSINKLFFDVKYLNLGASYADRLEHSMSFTKRASGKTLATDLTVNGKTFKAGTVLKEELLEEMDRMPIDSLKVVHASRVYNLRKYSTLTFRALGCTLKEDACGIKAGTVLTSTELDTLDASDLTRLTVGLANGDVVTLNRRVRPRTLAIEDVYTMACLYADVLNNFDYQNNPYELTNRTVIPFDKKALQCLETNLQEVVRSICKSLKNCSSDNYLFEAVRGIEIDTNTFIASITNQDNKEGQMADTNNVLHFLSKNYKVMTDMNRSSATDKVRRVQDLQLGRTDSIDSPESASIGLVHQRTLFARETDDGYLTAPFLKVENGKVISKEPVYITAQDEVGKYIAEFNETFCDENGNLKPRIVARYNGNIVTVETSKVTLKEYTQLQNMSAARSLIPFGGNSNAKRLLMGCNHQKQALQTLDTERPLVGTGAECIIPIGNHTARSILTEYYEDNVRLYPKLAEYKDVILNSKIMIAPNGISEAKSTRTIIFEILALKDLVMREKIACDYRTSIKIPWFSKTFEKSIYSYKLVPSKDNCYQGDDLVACTTACDTNKCDLEVFGDYGGLKISQKDLETAYGPGRNLIVGYKTMTGSTIDDAICISSRLVYDETLTTITMVSEKVELHKSDTRSETFGLKANNGNSNLGYNGIARVGAVLHPGDMYASIITKTPNKESVRSVYLDENTQGQVVASDIKEADGKTYAEIILAYRSNIEPGDKMSGRCGNKGVVARVIPEEQMPYDPVSGVKLDVILNPLGIPSRMNITQLYEVTLAYAMKLQGKHAIVAPFSKGAADWVREQAKGVGVKPLMLCDGRTGVMFKRPVNVGIQYMYKLVHLVKKKINAISLDEPVDPVFLQPIKGAKNNGGQACGEMESWCFQAIGANHILQTLYSTMSDDAVNKDANIEALIRDPDSFDPANNNMNDATMQAFTRAMCIDVTTTPDGVWSFRPLKDEKIRSLSVMSIMDETDLHNPAIFLPDDDPTLRAEGKYKWSYIDLKCEIVSPFWVAKGNLTKYMAVMVVKNSDGERSVELAKSSFLVDLLNGKYFVEKTIETTGYPTIYKTGDQTAPADSITSNKALIYIFKNYDVRKTLAIYERELMKDYDPQNVKKSYVDTLKFKKYLEHFIESGSSLADYVVSSLPVLPQTYRPRIESASRNRTSDFDKAYIQILRDVRAIQTGETTDNVLALLKDIEQLIGYDKLAKDNIKADSERTNYIKWFTGSGDTSNSKHHGKIRDNTLRKRIFCSGRSVIITTQDVDMLPTELGLPIAMVVKMYKQPLIGYLGRYFGLPGNSIVNNKMWAQLFNAIAAQSVYKFEEIFNYHFLGKINQQLYFQFSAMPIEEVYTCVVEKIREYIEGNADDPESRQVCLMGRQPSLHQFSIRAFFVKIVQTKAIQIHPLVCSGFNADFDGDTTWLEALLKKEDREEARKLMMADCTMYNPKDSSPILMPAQDIALGIYCATMLKNNVANVYETPEVLKDVRWYSDIDTMQTDVDLGLLEYHSLVVYNNGEHSYYSTAGRILFNSLIPNCFTDKPFSNTLNLPIPSAEGFSTGTTLCDLKYDGVVAVKGGTRNEIKYCKLSSICQDMISDFGSECIQYYQNLTKFGFHASDQCAVTLSLDDISIAIEPDKLLGKYDESYNTLKKEAETGVLDEASFKKKSRVLKENLNTALAGYKGQDGVEDMKHVIIADADRKKVMLELDYQFGLVSAEGKKDGVQKIYKDAAEKVKKALPAAMDRNNNLFIIFDSGSRGNIGQIMQTAGMIGILQKTKTENMEMPVTGNYAEGVSSFDMHISSYSARTGVASTQNETQNAGHATRTIVYMLSGIKIVEDDCGKDDWWYDVKYGAFKNAMKFYPNEKYFNQRLLGKRLNLKDKETSRLLGDLCKDGIITMDCFSTLEKNGFSSLALLDDNGKKAYLDITLNNLNGMKVVDDKTKHVLKEFLHEDIMDSKCLSIITASKLKKIETAVGTYELFYSLDPVVPSLLLGREARDLPYLENVFDPNSRKGVNVISKKTIKYIEENGLERIPARILLDCHSKGGICAHCYGKLYTKNALPNVGKNVGIESAQALGEPSAQLTMSLFHTGGAAGTSIAGGVEILQHLLQGTNPGGANSDAAAVAAHNGYVRIKKIDSQVLACIIPEENSSLCEGCLRANNGECPYKSNEFGKVRCKVKGKMGANNLLCQDGQYVELGDGLTAGFVLPNDIEPDEFGFSMKEVIRKKQMVWLMTYFNTFLGNGIDINARHFEILTRCQNSLVTVLNPGVTDLEFGKEYEIGELMRKYAPKQLDTVQLYCKTSEKYSVVTHYSGPLAMITFEDVANHLATFTNTDMDSSTMSPIGDIFVGNDVATGKKKVLRQPAIKVRDDELIPDLDDEFPLRQDDAIIEYAPEEQEREVLDELDLSALDAFDDEQTVKPPVEEAPTDADTAEEDDLSLDDLDLNGMDLF